MSTTPVSDRFTALPDDQTLAATVTALEEHGFGVEVVDDLDAARDAVIARIPEGSSVMTNTSVTLHETGIAEAIDDGGPYDSARNKLNELDYATQLPEMKAIGGQPDFALGSVHAITSEGTLVIASASGSQLASYAWGAANVIFVVGAQKLVPDLEAAHERIVEHSLPLEDARAYAAYGHEQPRREGPRDPPGGPGPHPRGPDPPICRVLMREPTVDPLDEEVDHVRGPSAGRLIIEYGDYECPYSRQAFREIEVVEQRRPGVSALPSGISRSRRSTRTPSQRRPQPRPPPSKAGSGTCTSCSFIASTHSRTTICGGTRPSSSSTSHASTATEPAPTSWAVFAGTSRAERHRVRCGAHRPCSSTASCTSAATTRPP